MEIYIIYVIKKDNGDFYKIMISKSEMKRENYPPTDYIKTTDIIVEVMGEVEITGNVEYLDSSMISG